MRILPPAWIESAAVNVPPEILAEVCGSHLISSALVRRGITSLAQAREYLAPNDPGPDQPFQLPGMQAAVERVQQAIRSNQRIGVWGDFDVDGQTSTAILVKCLRALGADVIYHLPVRGPESHGISLPYLEKFLSAGVKLMLTCDTGISDVDAADYCRQAGVDLIITDHHTLPQQLPSASVLINPHFLPNDHPLAPLCGAGTAFQLSKALLTQGKSSTSPDELIDLAALGTLADVASLWGENRYLAKSGLDSLRQSNRMAIRILFNNAKIDPSSLNEESVTFQLAPRLNAVGRLADANPVVEFLLSNDTQFVNTYALQVEGLNGQRRILLQNVESAALHQLEQNPSLLDRPTILASHPLWPGGVLGIVAGNFVKLFQRPAFVLRLGDDGIARGSARSPDGVDIIQAITGCSDLLLSFGGHAKAAGFSLRAEDLPRFQSRIDQAILDAHPEGLPPPSLEIEAYLSFSQITLDLADQIDRLAPFGEGNPEILLAAKNVEIVGVKQIGKNQEHSKLTIRDETDLVHDVLHWQSAGTEYPGGKFDLAYTLRKGSFRGKPQLTLTWAGLRQDQPLPLDLKYKSPLEIVDRRDVRISAAEINEFAARPGVVVFREGTFIPSMPAGFDRRVSNSANELILSMLPPDWDTLEQMMSNVSPKRVLVYDLQRTADPLPDVLMRLAGLVKFVINIKVGQTTLTELAIQCAQTEVLIRLGVDLFTAQGDIDVQIESDGAVKLNEPGHPSDPRRLQDIKNALDQVYQESRAFRDYFRSANLDDFLSGF